MECVEFINSFKVTNDGETLGTYSSTVVKYSINEKHFLRPRNFFNQPDQEFNECFKSFYYFFFA